MLIKWRAEPANTPLVEQVRLWHLCLRRGFWWEQNSQLLALENEPRRPTAKAEVFERLLAGREPKLRGCGKLVCVGATAEGNHSAKRDASTKAGYFEQSGIHAAEEVRSGARFARGGPRFIWERFIERSNCIDWPHLGQSGADSSGGASGWECDARAGRPKSKGLPE